VRLFCVSGARAPEAFAAARRCGSARATRWRHLREAFETSGLASTLGMMVVEALVVLGRMHRVPQRTRGSDGVQ